MTDKDLLLASGLRLVFTRGVPLHVGFSITTKTSAGAPSFALFAKGGK
jgi:hypothetical protein